MTSTTIDVGWVHPQTPGRELLNKHTKPRTKSYFSHNCSYPRNCKFANKFKDAAKRMDLNVHVRHLGGELEVFRIR